MPSGSRADYAFEEFRLSADGTLLTRDGQVVTLAPKVLQTLLVLVQRAGDVVRKEDMLQAVWPDSFVEDIGLTRNISLLRQALGDDRHRVIVTIARIGYRFAAPVRRGGDVEPSTALARVDPKGPHGARGSAIVGRHQELTLLRSAFARARNGFGGIVGVAGEPGIGKTTLIETFRMEVSGHCAIGSGSCSERLAGAEPHLPVLEALEELTTSGPALADLLSATAPTWAQYVTGGVRDGRNAPQVAGGGPERLMRELTTFLEHASRARAILILVEDLHWADVSTIDVLAHLAPRIARMPVLVVVSYRERDMLVAQHPFARLRGELIARGHLEEAQVSLLGLEDVRSYLRSIFGEEPVPAELAAVVFQRSEGNPLFMAEVVRYIQQRGTGDGVSSLARDVPDSLRGLIDRMLQGLDPATRQLLSIAAVQGYEFDSATVSCVSGGTSEEVEERLQTADLIHALLKFARQDELPDGALCLVYRFSHVLYQDALLASIGPSRRVEWARQIADALVLSHARGTDDIAGPLAILFETGREFWKASEYFLRTSRHATRHFAFASASDLASRGLKCLKSARGIHPADTSRRELDLTFARLLPLASIQGYASSDVEHLTQRVVELAEALEDVTAAATALGATWIVKMVRGECEAAKSAGMRLAALAKAARDDILLINAHMNVQIACHHLGEFRPAREYAAAVIAMGGDLPHPERCISILDPVVASLAESARNSWITGYLAHALSTCQAAVTLGRELRHPDSLAFAWLFHAWIHGYRGDWSTCLVSAATGINIASESGSVQTLAWNRCVHGWALTRAGDAATGESELADGIRSSKEIMGQVALPQFSAMMAEVLIVRDDLGGAERWLKGALQFETSHDDRYFAAEVRRLSAVCAARQSRSEEALALLREAIGIAHNQAASMFELRAALTLAELRAPEGLEPMRAALAGISEPESWPEVTAARRILLHDYPADATAGAESSE